MLTDGDRRQFDESGFVRIAGAFSPADAAAMEACVWGELERRHGVRRERVETWGVDQAFGFQRIAAASVFAPIGGPRLGAAIDDLLGPGRWDLPKRWGQILVTFPVPNRRWAVPSTLWHADFSFALPPDPLPGLKAFIFVSSVRPHGGGTLVVAGSHRLVERFVAPRPASSRADTRSTRLALLGSHPWLADLTSRTRRDDGIGRFVDAEERVGDDVALRVAELTGDAGDVVLTHPWVLHCRGWNSGETPRMMRAHDVYRRGVPFVTRATYPSEVFR